MKKKILSIALLGIMVLGVSVTANAKSKHKYNRNVSSNSYIGVSRAMNIALKKVPGANSSHVKEIHLDRENGRMVYEIEVMDGNIERDYEIDAETGAIVKLEQEQKNHGNNNSVNNPKISYDKAKEIELKHKNGVLVYDVEIAEGFMDREFLIDANTGEILRDKKDF